MKAETNDRVYIEMCEKAEEIQRFANNKWDALKPCFLLAKAVNRVALYIWIPNTLRDRLGFLRNEVIISVESNRDAGILLPEGTIGEVIWLPTQSQLQKMLGDFNQSLNIFDNWREGGYDDFIYWEVELKTYEQVWLALVMGELYHKKWRNGKWEIATDEKWIIE